jgi:hypothetical protein
MRMRVGGGRRREGDYVDDDGGCVMGDNVDGNDVTGYDDDDGDGTTGNNVDDVNGNGATGYDDNDGDGATGDDD